MRFIACDAAGDAQWFAANVWPHECPDLKALAEEFTGGACGLRGGFEIGIHEGGR